jgi:hypothetical protein
MSDCQPKADSRSQGVTMQVTVDSHDSRDIRGDNCCGYAQSVLCASQCASDDIFKGSDSVESNGSRNSADQGTIAPPARAEQC